MNTRDTARGLLVVGCIKHWGKYPNIIATTEQRVLVVMA